VQNDPPENGVAAAPLYGWRDHGSYGVMSRDEIDSPNFEVYPTFYIYKLLHHFAGGGDTVISAISNYALLSAHATRRVDGSLALLVINKNPTTAYNAKISIAGFTPGAAATVYSYGIPQDDAAKAKQGAPGTDIAQTPFAHAGASFAYSFPPYSATVIALTNTTKSNDGKPAGPAAK
jgi:hypothetical protein